MRIKDGFLVLVVVITAVSATTRPADTKESPPALALFVQATPPRYGNALSVVFEVTNRGQSKMELDHVISFARDFPDISDEANKLFGTGTHGLLYNDGNVYRVRLHVASPLPKAAFQQDLDLRIFGGPGEPTLIEPGKSFLYRIDLPAELGLEGHCEIYFSLIQQKHELARSETAKFELGRPE